MGITPNRVTLEGGEVVTRQDSLPVAMFGGLVPCAPYDDHFIYGTTVIHQSAYMCTCGSPAVIVNLGTGTVMFVCLYHMNAGVHATGGRTWV